MRVTGDELLQLGHELLVAAEREVGVDSILERREAEGAEVRGRSAGRLGRQVGERRPAPEREGIA